MAKRILVTGADGFIGSHLVEILHEAGWDIRALSLYNSFNNWGWLEDVSCKNDIEIVSGDIRDPHYCRKITKEIDIVMHLAALIAIPYSYAAPDSYVDTNIKGTLNLCQAALDNDVARVVHTSTSEVYGTAQYVPIDEAHPLQPQSPYSATKIGADAMAMSFHHAFDLPVTVARPFNTYGPRQSARAVIPTIIMQLASGESTVRLGDVRPTRDFNYVEDTCRGLLVLATSDKTVGSVFNIGCGEDIAIADLFRMTCELMGVEADYQSEDERIRPDKSEVMRLQCDASKLTETTGFRNEILLQEGLKRTIDWFTVADNLSKYKTHIYNV